MESAAAATTTVANHDDQNQMSEYELSREQRIRENRERMGKLGIMDLSLKLKSSSVPPKRSYRSASTPKTPPTLRPSAPVRRSSRLQNVTPVSYSEVPAKKAEFEGNRRIVIEEGAKPEVYTEEHEKLLGYTEKSWTLFVDGCGKDGKRIYDSIKGKTCHQCRQKTLGYRTHCSNCKIVQGQFCGDCLYMRYGEHVLEALQNPTWLCPVCRGICNCSLCRQAKGWAPTGPMYKKIKALGYKSVAHYLVQTRRSGINEEKKADVSNPFLAKMSPPLSDVEINENLVEKKADVSNPVSAKRSPPLSDVEINENLVEKNADVSNPVSAKRSLPFSDVEINENLDIKENHLGLVKPPSKTESGGNEVSVKRSLLFSDDGQDPLVRVKCLDTVKPLDSSPKPCSDSIARRLRPRLKKT